MEYKTNTNMDMPHLQDYSAHLHKHGSPRKRTHAVRASDQAQGSTFSTLHYMHLAEALFQSFQQNAQP